MSTKQSVTAQFSAVNFSRSDAVLELSAKKTSSAVMRFCV